MHDNIKYTILNMLKEQSKNISIVANKINLDVAMYQLYDYDSKTYFRRKDYKVIYKLKNNSEVSRIRNLIFQNYLIENSVKLKSGLPCTLGVYYFMVREDIDISLSELFLPFIRIGTKNEDLEYILPFTPKINLYKGEENVETIKFKKGHLIYVGETQNIHARYCEHMNSEVAPPTSMKLSLRKKLQENVDFYYIEINKSKISEVIKDTLKNDKNLKIKKEQTEEKLINEVISKYSEKKFRKELERYIRNAYGVRFGK